MNPTIKAKLAEIKKAKKVYAAAMAKHGKGLVKEMAADIMATHPEVLAIRWEQYTPWEMESGRCEFHIEEPEPKLSPAFVKTLGGHFFLEYDSGYGSLDTYSGNTPVSVKAINKMIEKFFFHLDLLKDALLECFGDHCRVIITNKGKVSVEEITHE